MPTVILNFLVGSNQIHVEFPLVIEASRVSRAEKRNRIAQRIFISKNLPQQQFDTLAIFTRTPQLLYNPCFSLFVDLPESSETSQGRIKRTAKIFLNRL